MNLIDGGQYEGSEQVSGGNGKGSSQLEIQQLASQLHSVFSLKDSGEMSYFLGIEDLLKKAAMNDAKGMPTPMTSALKRFASGGAKVQNPQLYRSIVGGLQYATISRPDITFVVNKAAQFMHEPLESHWKAVKRILSDIDDRKSTNGFCIYLDPNLWKASGTVEGPTISDSAGIEVDNEID
ncbi:uncharacterized protein LOC107620052 [Arachis ipaensis]|uniref:uncharacterized protein LOC107620052 n=1 Tax=Arachis ipaensis TaxID=130454 RepID=UPI0007AF416B|nr:uncharacterized protein LOC107620052 [Arachis ipaensis]XP_025684625.1 uncharacterized protein LOC112785369 [Arachis hypogaea]